MDCLTSAAFREQDPVLTPRLPAATLTRSSWFLDTHAHTFSSSDPVVEDVKVREVSVSCNRSKHGNSDFVAPHYSLFWHNITSRVLTEMVYRVHKLNSLIGYNILFHVYPPTMTSWDTFDAFTQFFLLLHLTCRCLSSVYLYLCCCSCCLHLLLFLRLRILCLFVSQLGSWPHPGFLNKNLEVEIRSRQITRPT